MSVAPAQGFEGGASRPVQSLNVSTSSGSMERQNSAFRNTRQAAQDDPANQGANNWASFIASIIEGVPGFLGGVGSVIAYPRYPDCNARQDMSPDEALYLWHGA